MYLLSILIPTIKRHDRLFNLLKFELFSQILPYKDQIEVLWDDHETDSIGAKRNRLLERATGEYIAFIDADDKVSINYIDLVMEGVEKGVDCCSLRGVYTENGREDGIFEHSLKYDKWETVEGEPKYLRFPNHLNTIKASIAKQFKFPEKNHGEDFDWSAIVHESGLLKTEHYINEILYFYNYISNKNEYEVLPE